MEHTKDNTQRNIHLLGDLLGEAISDLESPAIFKVEEQIRALAKARRKGNAGAAKKLQQKVSALNADEARAVAAAFTAYFDLVNLAEENNRVRLLREEELASLPNPVEESIEAAFAALKERGVNQERIAELLESLSIELVLTAHPTEARRRTILSKLGRMEKLVQQLNQEPLFPHEEEEILNALRGEISSLWLTDRVRADKITAVDEVRTGLYFVDTYLWDVIPSIYHELEKAVEKYYPGLKVPRTWLKLASWIGGDRDGNPYVTFETTADTLMQHRGLAVNNHHKTFRELARHLSVSSKRVPPPAELLQWIESRKPFPAHVNYIGQRYASEPYRLIMSLLAYDLQEAGMERVKSRLLSETPSEHSLSEMDLLERESQNHKETLVTEDLIRPLELILSALPQNHVRDELQSALRKVKAFGLHVARLDLREDSSRLNAALSETLRALNRVNNFEQLPDDERMELLVNLLNEEPPNFSKHPGVTAATAETWRLFQLIGRAIELYGNELLGAFVISMTHAAADVLTVLLLAKWAGCKRVLPITPLFESVQDLADAPRILDLLFNLDIYREHLKNHNDEQMVMIGYSDSNKDGGYFMANWALYQAQEGITNVARKHNIKLTIFHGRGGTVARGGGPANHAIRAQPAGSINGRFRVTEQGEIIASRYSNTALGHRHLEQIISAVILASIPTSSEPVPQHWRDTLDKMAKVAQRTYRGLVYETPGFIQFWQSATPLDEIKRLQIGSRPVSRASSGEVEQIRAIPWVFSWMQSRFNLPGWYSLGTGLTSLNNTSLLMEMYDGWPFFSTLLNNCQISMLKADMDISALYVDLVPDKKLADKIFNNIRSEYERTRENVLAISRRQDLLELEPITQKAVHLRSPYIDPLNYIQVDTLRRLRALSDPEGREAKLLREVMAMTINGISSALKNTG